MKKRNIIFCFIALVCFVILSPVLLFLFYPYSAIGIPAYVVLTTVCSILSCKSKKSPYQILSFGLFCLPILAFVVVLIGIQTGWIVYPP